LGRRRADYRNISPDYFETMGIRLVSGRSFDERDRDDSAPVAIVNQRFVERWVTDREPIGTRIQIGAIGPEEPWFEIVGVVGNVRHFAIDQPAEPEVYAPYTLLPRSSMTVVARASGDPMGLSVPIRRATGNVDATLPLYDVQPLEAAVSNILFGPTMITMLFSTFALLALLLASVGLYGLIAHGVAQRRAEIGVRMALGATKRDIVKLVFGSGAVTLTIGLLVGLSVAVLASRALGSLLYDLDPLDPVTFAGVTLAVGVVAMVAHLVPAWTAARLDPAHALRCE
jgi:putative ABC transport system permease protein